MRRGLQCVSYHDRGARFSTKRNPNDQQNLRHRPPEVGEEEEWDELFTNLIDQVPGFAGSDYLDESPFAEGLTRKRDRDLVLPLEIVRGGRSVAE